MPFLFRLEAHSNMPLIPIDIAQLPGIVIGLDSDSSGDESSHIARQFVSKYTSSYPHSLSSVASPFGYFLLNNDINQHIIILNIQIHQPHNNFRFATNLIILKPFVMISAFCTAVSTFSTMILSGSSLLLNQCIFTA